MKNIGMLLLLSLLLVACGDEKTTVSSEGEVNTKNEAVEKESIAKVEIEQQVYEAWTDSIDTVWVHSAAILKNTGETAVEIGETQMNYKGQDDSVLGTSTMIYSIPRVVNPGETAFVGESTILDGVPSDKDFKETTFNFNFQKNNRGS